MKVGTVREIKNHEYRVGLTPNCVAAYRAAGHRVLVERGAGHGAGYEDVDYELAGAELMDTASEVWGLSDMIVKVKEPLEEEVPYFRSGLLLYTYLHLAANLRLSEQLLATGVNALAYETIEEHGTLPCLRPMSEIAGRLSVQEGARCLERPYGGRGVLLGGVPGVQKGRVLVLGAGTVGMNACRMALGLGAQVTVMDISHEKLALADDLLDGAAQTLYNHRANLEAALWEADLIIGAVLIPGAAAPKIITRDHLSRMRKGAVIVDVAVDQGGCCETTHPTTHDAPTYIVDNVVHYCVANMPGGVPHTSTQALTNVTLRYGLQLAARGVESACSSNRALARGLNTYQGSCTNGGVAKALGIMPEVPVFLRG